MAGFSEVGYRPIDAQAKETGESFPITLNDKGEADLSKLPDLQRRTLEQFGISDVTKTRRLFPRDGQSFLDALPGFSNGYLNFEAK